VKKIQLKRLDIHGTEADDMLRSIHFYLYWWLCHSGMVTVISWLVFPMDFSSSSQLTWKR